jgi:hypothetical protein
MHGDDGLAQQSSLNERALGEQDGAAPGPGGYEIAYERERGSVWPDCGILARARSSV